MRKPRPHHNSHGTPVTTPPKTQQPSEKWARAIEPEPSVTITEETFFGHGWQPLTIAILQALWFLPPGEEFDVPELTKWFRALGWKSANGKPLGEDAVRRELALIRKAGYVRTYRIRLEGGQLGGARYEISKRPKPPQERIEYVVSDPVNSQVTPDASDQGIRSHPDASNGEKTRSDLMPRSTGSGGSPTQADRGNLQVTPDASNEGFPPTPPLEEVDTSSPNPLKRLSGPSGHRGLPVSAAEETSEEFEESAIAKAAEWLQSLPSPWAVGRMTSNRYAPLLLEAIRAQGWELDDALAAELTKGPLPRSCTAALKARIGDLVRRDRASALATVPYQAHRTASDLPEHCGDLECDEADRTRSEPGSLVVHRCPKCHPALAAAD